MENIKSIKFKGSSEEYNHNVWDYKIECMMPVCNNLVTTLGCMQCNDCFLATLKDEEKAYGGQGVFTFFDQLVAKESFFSEGLEKNDLSEGQKKDLSMITKLLSKELTMDDLTKMRNKLNRKISTLKRASLNADQLIEKFKKEMGKLGVSYFAPQHPQQFRVEMGTVGNRGGHVYADFLNSIKTEEDLQSFVRGIKTEKEAMAEIREEVENGNYWSNPDNFI